MKKLLTTTMSGIAAAAVLASSVSAACTNDRWNKVMERGKIVIGVKADYKPWGYRDSDGNLVGMEIDMAMACGRDHGWSKLNWWLCNPLTGCSFWSRARSI